MKDILFEKHIDLAKRTKRFTIDSGAEDQQCRTRVRKSFSYAVYCAKKPEPVNKRPIVFIRKTFQTKKGVEAFEFHVKGAFYLHLNGALIKVRFYHKLDIEIQWKVKDFATKKSASLA